MAAKGWKRRFEDPIPLPRGRQVVTLKDAADYIMKLPKAEQNLDEWQTATRCLIGTAERRDFLMHASHRHAEGVEPARRARVQSGSERHPLGKAEAKEGRIIETTGAHRKAGAAERSAKMSKRRWIFLLISVAVIGSVTAGTRYYLSKCHGMDACAAAEAESHERDKPSEAQ
jgi:hypothetical protein